MTSKFVQLMTAVRRLIRSPKFFYIILVIFLLQAVWVAVTARYPQAFDESYHFGLIQLHAKQLLPFFNHQPANSSVFGPIIHDPSYLYHYLLSFPYRVLVALHTSQLTQVICLRLINVTIFVTGILVYRRLFNELRIGIGLRNIVLFFFVLLPVVPILAGQINYDNLMFLLTGLIFLYDLRFMRWLRDDHQRTAAFPILLLLQIVVIGAAGSIVTFAFAPLFLATMIALGYLTFRHYRSFQLITQDASCPTKVSLHNRIDLTHRTSLLIFTVLAIVFVLLCIERYGYNIVAYHSPVPTCNEVLTLEECQSYAPWDRDYLFETTKSATSIVGTVAYPLVWVHRIVYETMFTITSYFEANGTVGYTTALPIGVGDFTAWTIIIIGGLLAIIYGRQVFAAKPLRVLLAIIGFYTLILFLQNFSSYRHTGEVVSVHGRYFVAVYPLLLLVLGLAFEACFRQYNTKLNTLKIPFSVIIIVLFLQGGGISVWNIRSDDSWFIQQSQPAIKFNRAARTVLDHLIIQGKPRPTS